MLVNQKLLSKALAMLASCDKVTLEGAGGLTMLIRAKFAGLDTTSHETRITLPAHNYLDRVSVDYRDFKKLIKSQDCEAELSILDEKLTISQGEYSQSIPCKPDYSEFDHAGYPEQADGLSSLLDTLGKYAGKDDARDFLNGVLFAEKLVSTNGHRLVYTDNPAKLPVECIIPRSACVAIAKAKSAPVQYGYRPDMVSFRWRNGCYLVEISAYPIEGEYPNWTMIVPSSKPIGVIEYPVELLRTFIKASKPFFRQKAALRLSGNGRLTAEVTHGDIGSGSCDFGSWHKFDFSIGLNVNFLSALLPKEGVVKFDYHDDYSPVVYRDGQFNHVVMPIKVN